MFPTMQGFAMHGQTTVVGRCDSLLCNSSLSRSQTLDPGFGGGKPSSLVPSKLSPVNYISLVPYGGRLKCVSHNLLASASLPGQETVWGEVVWLRSGSLDILPRQENPQFSFLGRLVGWLP